MQHHWRNNTANGVFMRSLATPPAKHNTALRAHTGVNTATGRLNNITGISNTATGVSALQNNTTGDFNTAIGVGALFFNTTGNNNTALGVGAGNFTTANDVICIRIAVQT